MQYAIKYAYECQPNILRFELPTMGKVGKVIVLNSSENRMVRPINREKVAKHGEE